MNLLDKLPDLGEDPLQRRRNAPVGRPSKFTEETRSKILAALRGGNYREVACRYAGVSYQTFRNWLKMGEDPSSPPEYQEFLEAVEKAEADAEVADIALIRKAAQEGSWTAAAWMRERKNPERWGRKDRAAVELTGAGGGPVDVRVLHGVDVTTIEGLASALARRAAEVERPEGGVIDAVEVVEIGGGDSGGDRGQGA
jgi:hypothetical protein